MRASLRKLREGDDHDNNVIDYYDISGDAEDEGKNKKIKSSVFRFAARKIAKIVGVLFLVGKFVC